MVLGIFTELIAKPITCAVTGAKCEFNLTAIWNPAVAVHESVNLTMNHVCDLNKGIWIGRSTLLGGKKTSDSSKQFGAVMSIGPGVDGCHWSIAVNGVVYEMRPDRNNTIEAHETEGVHKDQASYVRVGRGLPIVKCREEIKAWMGEYTRNNPQYDLKSNNCQHFVMKLGKFATDSESFSVQGAMGNMVW